MLNESPSLISTQNIYRYISSSFIFNDCKSIKLIYKKESDN